MIASPVVMHSANSPILLCQDVAAVLVTFRAVFLIGAAASFVPGSAERITIPHCICVLDRLAVLLLLLLLLLALATSCAAAALATSRALPISAGP